MSQDKTEGRKKKQKKKKSVKPNLFIYLFLNSAQIYLLKPHALQQAIPKPVTF